VALRTSAHEDEPDIQSHDPPRFASALPAVHDTRSLQAYLGHKSIQHTVRYSELAPTRFKDFWRE
jgi:hypothetical protein